MVPHSTTRISQSSTLHHVIHPLLALTTPLSSFLSSKKVSFYFDFRSASGYFASPPLLPARNLSTKLASPPLCLSHVPNVTHNLKPILSMSMDVHLATDPPPHPPPLRSPVQRQRACLPMPVDSINEPPQRPGHLSIVLPHYYTVPTRGLILGFCR